MTVCIIGLAVVIADDFTGIGVADDFLYGPLGTGVGKRHNNDIWINL